MDADKRCGYCSGAYDWEYGIPVNVNTETKIYLCEHHERMVISTRHLPAPTATCLTCGQAVGNKFVNVGGQPPSIVYCSEVCFDQQKTNSGKQKYILTIVRALDEGVQQE